VTYSCCDAGNVFFSDDESKGSQEFSVLVENFRSQAATLVDMLDMSIPAVAKLKANTYTAFPSITVSQIFNDQI